MCEKGGQQPWATVGEEGLGFGVVSEGQQSSGNTVSDTSGQTEFYSVAT